MKPCLSHYRHRPHSRRARRPWLLTAAALPLLATLVIAGSTAKEKRQVQVTKAYLRKEPREMCVPHASLNYADVVELDGTQDPWSQVHAASDPNQQGWLFTEVITKTELFRHQGDVPKGFQPNENGARIADKGLGDPNLVSWGSLLSEAQERIGASVWLAFFPGMALSLLVLCVNLFGDGINDVLNPKLRKK